MKPSLYQVLQNISLEYNIITQDWNLDETPNQENYKIFLNTQFLQLHFRNLIIQ